MDEAGHGLRFASMKGKLFTTLPIVRLMISTGVSRHSLHFFDQNTDRLVDYSNQ